MIFFFEDIIGFMKCKDMFSFVEFLYKGVLVCMFGKFLRNLCKREIVGFVLFGYFFFVCGCGFGVGFCVLLGFVNLIFFISDRGEVMVLVRSLII